MATWEKEDHKPLRKICGCSYTWGEGVQMCPMHEAAPDLLKQLKAARKELQFCCRVIHHEDYNNPTMNAVIAKAGG